MVQNTLLETECFSKKRTMIHELEYKKFLKIFSNKTVAGASPAAGKKLVIEYEIVIT